MNLKIINNIEKFYQGLKVIYKLTFLHKIICINDNHEMGTLNILEKQNIC